MSNKNKFVLNSAGVRALLRSDEMQEVLAERARAVQQRCGPGYESDTYVGKNRANAMVWAETHRAKRDNAKNNTLLKGVRG